MEDAQYPKVFLYRRLVQAKLYIDAHYAQPIDLRDIAEEAHSSRFHFIRQFSSIYGKTPHQYLVAVRMTHARELLKTGTTVTDACYAVGFESPATFSALFKKTWGITPSAYAREQDALRAAIQAAPLRYVPACFAEKNGWL